MHRMSFGFALAAALMLAGSAAAQKSNAMKATAPEKMTPPGASEAMRDCDKLAIARQVKMEDRARFVQDCVAKKMGRK